MIRCRKIAATLLALLAAALIAACNAPDEPRPSPRSASPEPAAKPQAKPAAAPAQPPARPAPKQLAEFPWPPPEPSAHVTLDDALFYVNARPAATLGAVNSRLEKALNQSGYEYSYYRAGNGFALVARLERIREDGSPQPDQFRFLQPGAREPFSLSSYVRQLFFAPAGFYRMIVFVATDQAIVSWGKTIDTEAATLLLRQGANSLTSDIEGLPWTRDHSVIALIYEFQKSAGNNDPITLRPSRLPARTHLERARIQTALTARP